MCLVLAVIWLAISGRMHNLNAANCYTPSRQPSWCKKANIAEFEKLKQAAEQGNVKAQNDLGVSYENGRGVIPDDAEAVKWYQKAAEQGDSYAQFNLGLMYHNGNGIAKNEAEAAKWFQKAAEQENERAQKALVSDPFPLPMYYY